MAEPSILANKMLDIIAYTRQLECVTVPRVETLEMITANINRNM